MGIEKLVMKHHLERGEIAAAHRRIALVLEGEDFLIAAHRQTSLAVSPRASSLRHLAWGLHSITSSARASTVAGTSRPSALAVLRLMTNSNAVGSWTGSSEGLSPLRIRPAYTPAWR